MLKSVKGQRKSLVNKVCFTCHENTEWDWYPVPTLKARYDDPFWLRPF